MFRDMKTDPSFWIITNKNMVQGSRPAEKMLNTPQNIWFHLV
jgi:hypothetical protein